MIPTGRYFRISSRVAVQGSTAEKTFNSRIRRAISCVYCEPKSRMTIDCSSTNDFARFARVCKGKIAGRPRCLSRVCDLGTTPLSLKHMLRLSTIGPEIALRRKALNLSQDYLAQNTDISSATLDALEEERYNDIGFTTLSENPWAMDF